MTTEGIKASLDFLNANKLAYDVIMDNGHMYSNGRKGHTIVWALEKELMYCVRGNMANDQPVAPIEFTVTEIEHIVSIRAYTNSVENATGILDNIGMGKAKDKVVEWLSGQDYVTMSNITGSTGDGVNWNAPVKRKAGSLISDFAPPQNWEEDKEEKKED